MHGCPACPHPAIGPAITGSPVVTVNGRPALRVDDLGVHAACCGTNSWTATQGSLTVFIDGKGAHRMTDQNRHCGGMGQLIEGSQNVIVGEDSGGMGAGSGGGGSAGGDDTRDGGDGGDGGASDDDDGDDSGGASDDDDAGDSGGASDDDDGGDSGGGDMPTNEDSFIEIELVDAAGTPVANERYRLTAANGQVFDGTLDATGSARIEPVPSGNCQIEFPDRAPGEWAPEAA